MYGAFLRQVRTSRGMTQAQVAENCGISQPNLSAYENDRRAPSLDVANRILVACGYQLMAEAGPRRIAAPLASGFFPDEDLPPRLPDDPPDEEPSITRDTPMIDRVTTIHGLMALAEVGR